DGLLRRGPLAVLGVLAFGLAVLVCLGCGSKEKPAGRKPNLDDVEGLAPIDVTVPKVSFTDVTRKAGIHFTHTNGSFGKKLLPETMGSGVAFLDFDNDGRQDLLFVNSCYWPGHEGRDRPTLKLYRNKGQGVFEDVTASMRL